MIRMQGVLRWDIWILSEKTFINYNGTYAAFSVFGITDAKSKIGVNGTNNVANPVMAYCVLPIKEQFL